VEEEEEEKTKSPGLDRRQLPEEEEEAEKSTR
jgi:hypothetical protein